MGGSCQRHGQTFSGESSGRQVESTCGGRFRQLRWLFFGWLFETRRRYYFWEAGSGERVKLCLGEMTIFFLNDFGQDGDIIFFLAVLEERAGLILGGSLEREGETTLG